MADVIRVVMAVVIVGLYLAFMFWPHKIAKGRHSKSADVVRILCAVSIFIPIVWVAAIIIACSSETYAPGQGTWARGKGGAKYITRPEGYTGGVSLSMVDETK